MLSHSTKYDGSLHYRIPVDIIDATPTRLVTFRSPGVPIDSYRGQWNSGWNVLNVYWTDRHWNLCVHWEGDWQPRELYVNIATPASWDHEAVRWTDLDLDLILPHAAAEPKLDDADEFEHHRERFAYPAELVESCLAAAVDVAAQMRARNPLFDGRLFHWRPGQPLPPLA